MRAKPTLYFVVLALLLFLLAFKIKALLLPSTILIAVIGLTYVYSRRRSAARK